jgi:hypothetical protein
MIRVPLKGCTRIYVTRHGDVGAQRGLTTQVWVADANDPVSAWISMPFAFVAALWWLLVGN